MPRLILHTGVHKTGTTTLQHMLHENSAGLARQGFLFPRTGLTGAAGSWGQHELAYSLRSETKARALWQALRAEVDASRMEQVILSSEELSMLPFPTLPGIQPYRLITEVFDGWDIVLVCYLRPQADLLASLYNHNVKSVGESREIIDFLSQIAPRLEYAHYLNVAALGLGEGAIRVRRYGKAWLRGDSVTDFAAEIGLNMSDGFRRPEKDLNPGLTDAGLVAMLSSNARLAGSPTLLKWKRRRIIAKHRAGPYESANPLSDEQRRVIQAIYRFKNIQIGRRFLGLDGDLFDPDVQPIRARPRATD